MAKLNHLRKNLAATRFSQMDSESDISGPFVYPLTSLHPQDSSGTLASNLGQINFKKGSRLRWNNRRTGLAITQLTEKSKARNIGKPLGHPGGTMSNPGLQNSLPKSKKAPRFLTFFLRRPSSRIKSDTSSIVLPVDPAPNRSPGDTQPFTGLQDLHWHPLAVNLTERTTGEVISSDPEIDYQSNFVPPIMITSPTLPDALCLAEERNRTRYLSRPADSERKKPYIQDVEEHTNFSQIPMMVKTLQTAARQLANDPSATQTNSFRLSAPITVFLYSLGIGVILLKKGTATFEPAPPIALHITIILGVLLVLTLLRGVVWVMSKLGRSFCDLDLEEVFARGIFVDSEGERLTEADFIVGNLIT